MHTSALRRKSVLQRYYRGYMRDELLSSEFHYCPRQPGIRRFGEGKSFILSTSPISLGGGLRGRHDPVQNGSEADVGRQNASSSTQNGYLRACRESFRPPPSGHRDASR